MSSRNILYITSDGLGWYRLRSGRGELTSSFDATEEGRQAFAARLASEHNAATFAVLVDVADEAFHIDIVPPVSGDDRRTMMNRKIAQHFY